MRKPGDFYESVTMDRYIDFLLEHLEKYGNRIIRNIEKMYATKEIV